MSNTPRALVFDAAAVETVQGRRHFLSQLAIAAGAVALTPLIKQGLGINDLLHAQSAPGQTEPNLTDNDILNYALALEYLEATFYIRADNTSLPAGATLAALDPDGNGAPGTVPGLAAVTPPAPATFNVPAYIRTVRDHEIQHVLALQGALGMAALPRAAFRFSFGTAFANSTNFLEVAQALEDAGVQAYLGQAGNVDTPAVLGSAGAILGVEAEHSATIRMLRRQPISAGDAAFDVPQTTTQILAVASGFITQAPTLPFPK